MLIFVIFNIITYMINFRSRSVLDNFKLDPLHSYFTILIIKYNRIFGQEERKKMKRSTKCIRIILQTRFIFVFVFARLLIHSR